MARGYMNNGSDDSEGRRADDWLTFAIVLGISSGVGIAFSLVWALGAEEELRSARTDIVYKVALLCAAVVTFCTVVWRGLISARQANYQQQQIDNLARQISAAEENNLAGLLQKGAELLGQADNRAHVAAGIATLQSLITAENPKFAREAMELLADHIDEKFQYTNSGPLFRSIIQALEAGATRGLVASRIVDFNAGDRDHVTWTVFRGVEGLSYIGGNISGFSDAVVQSHDVVIQCDGVKFDYGQIESVDDRFSNCVFENCKINDIGLSQDFGAIFVQCDFSGAIHSGSAVATVRFFRCFYDRDDPPSFPPEWLEKLAIRGDPETDDALEAVGVISQPDPETLITAAQ